MGIYWGYTAMVDLPTMGVWGYDYEPNHNGIIVV